MLYIKLTGQVSDVNNIYSNYIDMKPVHLLF